jgi:hypothetical protein
MAKVAGVEALAAAFPYNAAKPSEFGAAVRKPAKGQAAEPAEPMIGGSTLSETNASPKVGSGNPQASFNPSNGPLDRVRVDSTDRALTTNQGVPVADNQNSLKAGLRGPSLLEDFNGRVPLGDVLPVCAASIDENSGGDVLPGGHRVHAPSVRAASDRVTAQMSRRRADAKSPARGRALCGIAVEAPCA